MGRDVRVDVWSGVWLQIGTRVLGFEMVRNNNVFVFKIGSGTDRVRGFGGGQENVGRLCKFLKTFFNRDGPWATPPSKSWLPSRWSSGWVGG